MSHLYNNNTIFVCSHREVNSAYHSLTLKSQLASDNLHLGGTCSVMLCPLYPLNALIAPCVDALTHIRVWTLCTIWQEARCHWINETQTWETKENALDSSIAQYTCWFSTNKLLFVISNVASSWLQWIPPYDCFGLAFYFLLFCGNIKVFPEIIPIFMANAIIGVSV